MIRITRRNRELLVIDGAGLAEAFFTDDKSAVGEGCYDSLVGRPPFDKIEPRDIEALNRTMRARSPHEAWATITGKRLRWLSAIDPDLDLLEANNAEWRAADGERLIEVALVHTVGPRRGAAVATKMLHLKRPRRFPMLDQLVVEMLGARIPNAPVDVRARHAADLIMHLRHEGRRNLPPLREIQSQLAKIKIGRSLVRILDAVVWASHPAAGIAGARRVIECQLTEVPPEVGASGDRRRRS